jgi:hypothetical protein
LGEELWWKVHTSPATPSGALSFLGRAGRERGGWDMRQA